MVNGSCSLRVENHLPETQYVDALKLIVVDHPQGSRVIAGAPGEIHTVFEPQRPVEAVDDRGNVVLPLLARADSLSWISDPIGRDPEDPAAVRDGLTVKFDVPHGSDSAKLILSARNTFWAAELEERLLKLQGTDLDRWYEAMESSPEFRDSFVDIVRREAMLSVQVWTGETWKPVQYLAFPGPYLDKTFVVPVDLRQITGPRLQVRLESTVGLWMINSVSIDCSPAVSVQTTEAPLVRARDNHGANIGTALASADGQYYVLEQGDAADLAFVPPPERPGSRRSYILESNGYYRIHITPTGAPRRQLLSSFTNEPGAFGRYSLRILNGWLERELGKAGAGVAEGSSAN